MSSAIIAEGAIDTRLRKDWLPVWAAHDFVVYVLQGFIFIRLLHFQNEHEKFANLENQDYVRSELFKSILDEIGI